MECCECPPLKPTEKVIVGREQTKYGGEDPPTALWHQDHLPDDRCCVCPYKPAKKSTFEEISDEIKTIPADAGATKYKF